MLLGEAINILCPLAEYRGLIDDSTQRQFDAIEWCDKRPKPTWAEIEAAMATIEAEEAATAQAVAMEERLENYKLKAARELALIDNDIEAVDEIDIRLGRVIREITP